MPPATVCINIEAHARLSAPSVLCSVGYLTVRSTQCHVTSFQSLHINLLITEKQNVAMNKLT